MQMKKKQLISFFLLFTTCSVVVLGQDIVLKQTNKSGIYKKGQKISVMAFTGNQSEDSLRIRVLKNNKQVLERKAVKTDKDSILVFEGLFRESCSVIIEARSKEGNATIGLLVDPKNLKSGAKRPKDFKSFWDNEKKILQALPLEVKTNQVTAPEIETGYSCVNIEINCTGTKPVRGYFAKPEIAAPKSLPIVLLVHAAGVKGSWCRSEPKNAMNYAKMGALCFDLNAHGMLNGQPESYYADLEAGELRNYYLQGVTSRDGFYFRGMYLRLLRTIDFLTRQPEWDGKRILVIGESQGGGQALVAAGLDQRVSAVVAIVPAMCDWLAPLTGRMGGWPQPFETDNPKEDMMQAIPYYDAANILKDSKAIIFIEIGLIDMTCPSTSVYTAINQAKSEKIIYAVPYRPHQQPQRALGKTWEETVYKPRELFIKNYLLKTN
jgi:cephalosporin-C deacetylase-like acetyl esterase